MQGYWLIVAVGFVGCDIQQQSCSCSLCFLGIWVRTVYCWLTRFDATRLGDLKVVFGTDHVELWHVTWRSNYFGDGGAA